MTAPLVFLDTETTGLTLNDDIWEIAAIRREPDGTETELHIFVEHDRKKCEQLPPSFREDHDARYRDHQAYTRNQAASAFLDIVRNGRPHIVGAVPNFDTERLAWLLRGWSSDWQPTWHHHLIDVENLAVGYLARELALKIAGGDPDRHTITEAIAAPWDSDDLSRAVGIDPARFERHNAMGDVHWAMAIYDAVMGGAS